MALQISCKPFTVASWTTNVLWTMVWETLNQTTHIVHLSKTLVCLKAESSLLVGDILKYSRSQFNLPGT